MNNDELFRTLCANLANKIDNIAELSNTKMEEIKVELKSEDEKSSCDDNFKIIPISDENNSSKTANSPIIIPTRECTSSSQENNSNETRDEQTAEESRSDESHVLYQERYDRFQEFKKIEKSLCSDLGMSTKYHKYEILSPKKMEKCRRNLQKLYLLKKKRQLHYSQLIDEIKTLLSEMEIYTWSEFEKSALSTQFAVTTENLNALHAWKLRLLKQLELEKNAVEETKCKIADLWDKLSIDVKTRQDFLSNTFTKQSRKYVLNDLQREVHRCQKLWKQKIRHEVLNMRKEIIDLWVECHSSQKQREQFVAFNSEIFDEDLMIAHEQEINRLKQQYQETIELNKLACKWVELRSKLTELEINARSFKKFTNRGGSLLKGEKELKKEQKNVGTLESKIIHSAANYKNKNGSHFYFNGRPILQLIDELRNNNMKTEKENRGKSQTMPLKRASMPSKNRENVSLLRNAQSKSFSKPKFSSLGTFEKCSLKI
ncbi:protein regulator of cytokinesis 1-like [Planococcus citri]|uniref:protein regulator of cytokinesis 1-like n=1 Tax=Planococcus citri TaxID=170843 RepID=UPI0031F86F3F